MRYLVGLGTPKLPRQYRKPALADYMPETELKITSRLALLGKGLYIVRYARGPVAHGASCVALNPSPIGRGSIDFFPAEGITRNTLTKAGDCVVVRVKGEETGLLITEFATSPQTVPIELRIDRITNLNKGTSGANESESAGADRARPRTALLGHIQGAGDITVTDGWLGSPNALERIEGFNITVSGLPEGLILAYSCRSGKDAEPDVGTAGRFVGTRRQAKPITAVAFALSGERATDFRLTGQVVFAACPPLAIMSGKELSGPKGTEQLVALQLEIRPKAPQASPPASLWNDPSRTHIFNE